MYLLIAGIAVRILSNSYINVFQKILTNRGEFSSVINLYSYLGLTILGLFLSPNINFSPEIIKNTLLIGIFGCLGNYFIIKALSCGELSKVAPINSYKPVVGMFFAYFLLNEIPTYIDLLAILLIILGTFLLSGLKFLYNKAFFYRFLALIFSGTEAVFIKKVIVLTDINTAFFYWAFFGLFFSLILGNKHSYSIKKDNIKYQLVLILMIFLMQYSTNYVFSKMNVANALALFQLSTVLSVFLGIKVFSEGKLIKKVLASVIMLIGSIVLILF